ncbi:histidine--tRNA ligase [Chloroflexota bacterium]
MYQVPRGTSDILPDEQLFWHYVEHKAANIGQLYGYQRIDTPVFEDTRLFTRSVGEGTDVVEKQMYTFQDKGGNKITLRPEGTASVCRAYLEHKMHILPQPVKLYYSASIFRYERPQAGRFRQHHQFGAEAIGDNDPFLDAEVIDMAWHFFSSLGLAHISLNLNSIGCRECQPGYLTLLKIYYTKHINKLCPDCKTRLHKNPLRLLDCKETLCLQVANSSPRSIDSLCPQCVSHFNRLKEYLTLLNLSFKINHCLVRGLDYYTRTVFEFQTEDNRAQSAIGGGGRYDDLIEEIGGKPSPAIGFAAGIERIILNLKRQNVTIPPLSRPQLVIAYTSDKTKDEAIKLASILRRNEIGVIVAISSKSLKAQLRISNKLNVHHTIIIGEQGIEKGMVILRDMTTAQQQTIPLSKIQGLLK